MKISVDANAFSALKSYNFRRYLYVQVICVIGFWMQDTAMKWIVYELTGSNSSLGIISIVTQTPIIALTFLIGAWLDNANYRKVILATQLMTMFHAFTLAALVFSGNINYWYIVVLAGYYGFVNAVYWPARQASVVCLVDSDKDLKSGISIYSCLFNLSKLLGPSIAGWVIFKYGSGACFLFNALSYIPVMYVIYITTFRERKKKTVKQNAFKSMVEGFKYVKDFTPLRTVIIFLAVICLLNAPMGVLLPSIAKDILKDGSKMFGYLQGGIGFGAVIGGVFLSGFVKLRYLPFSIAIAATSLGLMQCWFASTAAVVANSLGDGGVMWYGSESAMPWAIFTILLTIPIGFSTVCTTVGINTLMQTVCDDDKRSRIISFYTICLNGVSALGMLACGFLADKFGTIQTTILFGVMTVVAAMVYLFNAPKVSKSLRPVFDMIEQES